MLFGVCGFVVAGDTVSGDVLKSFKHDDPLITVGRWGLLVALSLNITLLVVPIRAILLDMVGWGKPPPLPLQTAGRASAASKIFPAAVGTEEGGSATGGSATSAAAATPLWLHVLLTLAIVAVGLYLAVVGGSVEVVWGVCGSSVGISIVFVFPPAIYLKVPTYKYPCQPLEAGIPTRCRQLTTHDSHPQPLPLPLCSDPPAPLSLPHLLRVPSMYQPWYFTWPPAVAEPQARMASVAHRAYSLGRLEHRYGLVYGVVDLLHRQKLILGSYARKEWGLGTTDELRDLGRMRVFLFVDRAGARGNMKELKASSRLEFERPPFPSDLTFVGYCMSHNNQH